MGRVGVMEWIGRGQGIIPEMVDRGGVCEGCVGSGALQQLFCRQPVSAFHSGHEDL